jgi:hypothetical protein
MINQSINHLSSFGDEVNGIFSLLGLAIHSVLNPLSHGLDGRVLRAARTVDGGD